MKSWIGTHSAQVPCGVAGGRGSDGTWANNSFAKVVSLARTVNNHTGFDITNRGMSDQCVVMGLLHVRSAFLIENLLNSA